MNKELLNSLIQATAINPQYLFDDKNGKLKNKKLECENLFCDDMLIAVRADTSCEYFPKHTHNYVEIVYMCQGKSTHLIDGEAVILNEGEFLFLNKNCVQETFKSEKNKITVNFIVHTSFFKEILQQLGSGETPLHRFIIQSIDENNKKSCYLHFCVSKVLPIQNLAENLVWNMLNNVPEKSMLARKTMSLLFLQLLNHTKEIKFGYNDNSIITSVMEYIDGNYANGTLSELSKNMFYDFNALSKQIKKYTGKNYTELVQEKRISQASLLLKSTKLSISEIAQKVGYENESYFHRLFKKHYDISPKKYRDSCK